MAPHILKNEYGKATDPETDPHSVNEFNRLWLILYGQGIVGPIGARFYKNELYWFIYNNSQLPDTEVTPHQYLEKHMHAFYIEDREEPFGYRTITYDIRAFDKIWKQQAKKGERDTEFGGEYHGQLAEFLSARFIDRTGPTEKGFLAL